MLPPWPKQYAVTICRSDEEYGTRIYVDGDRERHEDLSGKMTTSIFVPGYALTLNDATKSYYRTKLPKLAGQFDPESMCVWTLKGEQKINGSKCSKYVGRYRKPFYKAYEVCYVDAMSHMQRRHITYDAYGKRALVIDFIDIVVGPQDPKLFKVPKGYKKGLA